MRCSTVFRLHVIVTVVRRPTEETADALVLLSLTCYSTISLPCSVTCGGMQLFVQSLYSCMSIKTSIYACTAVHVLVTGVPPPLYHKGLDLNAVIRIQWLLFVPEYLISQYGGHFVLVWVLLFIPPPGKI